MQYFVNGVTHILIKLWMLLVILIEDHRDFVQFHELFFGRTNRLLSDCQRIRGFLTMYFCGKNVSVMTQVFVK